MQRTTTKHGEWIEMTKFRDNSTERKEHLVRSSEAVLAKHLTDTVQQTICNDEILNACEYILANPELTDKNYLKYACLFVLSGTEKKEAISQAMIELACNNVIKNVGQFDQVDVTTSIQLLRLLSKRRF